MHCFHSSHVMLLLLGCMDNLSGVSNNEALCRSFSSSCLRPFICHFISA